jgi:hypothetical protein
MLDTSMKVGYGWSKSENKRFGETAYYIWPGVIPALAVGQHYGADPVGKGPVH